MERRKLEESGRSKVQLRSLSDLDGRTTAARAAFALRNAIAADLGGQEQLTAMQAAVVNSAALLGAMLENLGAQYLAGEKIDHARYATLANAQRRLLADLGLERRAKDVTPGLRDYVKRRSA